MIGTDYLRSERLESLVVYDCLVYDVWCLVF